MFVDLQSNPYYNIVEVLNKYLEPYSSTNGQYLDNQPRIPGSGHRMEVIYILLLRTNSGKTHCSVARVVSLIDRATHNNSVHEPGDRIGIPSLSTDTW